jgi:C1A family cysteine protease
MDPVNSSGLANETIPQSETSSVTTTTTELTPIPSVTETVPLTTATTLPATEVTVTETVQPEETEMAAADGITAPTLTEKTCSAASSGSGGTCSSPLTRYPLMHPSKADLDAEEAVFKTMEKYTAPVRRMSLTADSGPVVTSKSLLSYLSYLPAERDQGHCGNCWVWASTGALEVEHTVDTGINNRLSIQYFNSKFNNGEGQNWACCGGNIETFTSWYNSDRTPIPWSNTNAAFGDYDGTCDYISATNHTAVPKGTISTIPHYTLNSISYSAVATNGSGIDQSTAIANIKSAIDNNKAVYYGFSYGESGWDDFMDTFWRDQDESAIFDPTPHNGEETTGGHGVLLVGYNTTDRYWLVLNSWGNSTLRPNGLFRVKMDIDYDSWFNYTEDGEMYTYYPQHRFYVLDAEFASGEMPGFYRNSTGYWYLDYNTDGTSDKRFAFGTTPGDTPIVGDWDNDGVTEPGIFRSSTGYWYLDYNTDGTSDKKFLFGGGSEDMPVVGNWN